MDFHLSNCAHHPLKAAQGIGPRCGDFLCSECLLEDSEKCCENCLLRLSNFSQSQKYINVIMLILFNLFCGAIVLELKTLSATFLLLAIPICLLIIYMKVSPAPKGPSGKATAPSESEDPKA